MLLIVLKSNLKLTLFFLFYTRSPPPWSLNIPCTEGKEQELIVARMEELKVLTASYLASSHALPAWQAIGVPQPSYKEIYEGILYPLKKWVDKKAGGWKRMRQAEQEKIDLKLRFPETQNGSPLFEIHDMRKDQGCPNIEPGRIDAGNRVSGTFQLNEIYLRPQKPNSGYRVNKNTWTGGFTAYIKDLSVWVNEEEQFVIAD